MKQIITKRTNKHTHIHNTSQLNCDHLYLPKW